MRKIIYIIILSLVFVVSKAQNIEEANALYKAGKYQEAVDAYESILTQNLESSTLYFNLGNAYYKLNKVAPAILNYERAKLLNPTDRDINYNLRMSRTLVTDKIDTIPVFFLNRWMETLIMSLTSDNWAIVSVFSFCIVLALIIMFFFSSSRRIKKLTFSFSLVMLIFVISSAIFAKLQKTRLTEREYAIVFAPSVTIKGSPDNSGTELFVLHEGTKVKVIEKLGEWTNIQLSDGSEGWVSNKAISVI